MSPAHHIDQLRRREAIMRRHMRRAEAYRETVRVMRQMSYHDAPDFSVPFKPIHYYMHLLPGFNTHFIPAKFVGWRKLRAIDVTTDPDNEGKVRFSFNADYLRKRDW